MDGAINTLPFEMQCATYAHTHARTYTQQSLSAAPKAPSKRNSDRRPQTSCSFCSRRVGKLTAPKTAVICWMPASLLGQECTLRTT